MRKFFRKADINSFHKSIAVLFSGTILAQMVNLGSLPILTRLYSPEDFGLLAVYSAMLGIILTISSLRLEIAIPLPEQKKEAVNLLVLSMISTIVIFVLIVLGVVFFAKPIVSLINQQSLLSYLWLLPIGVLLGSGYNIFQYWATREKDFTLIAKTRVVQAVSGSSIQIMAGWNGAMSIGLIIGYIFNIGAGGAPLIKKAIKENYQTIKAVEFKSLKESFIKYQAFPKYSTFESLANTAGIQLPIIMIAASINAHQAGYLMLALKVMQVPMSFLGGAISQVYLSHAPASHKDQTLDKLTMDVLDSLVKLGVGPLIFVGIIGSKLFAIIFGVQWAYIGVLIAWMTPWFVMQFISSPISMVMHVKGKQKSMLLLTVIGFIIRVGSVSIAILYDRDIVVEVYAISGGVFYLLCFGMFSNAANLTKGAVFTLLLKNIPIIIGWGILGMILKVGI